MKKPLVVFKDWCICTDNPIIYYSILVLSSLAVGFFVAYVWIPLMQWIHTYV
jgi:hypothetical protein